MNPLEILYSWQAIIIATLATFITQFVKTGIDVYNGKKSDLFTPTIRAMTKVGRDIRKEKGWLNRLILPALPVLFGSLLAVVIPARPDPITTYVSAHELGANALFLYAAWGAACGQFADYIFSKVKGAMQAFAAPAVPDPVVADEDVEVEDPDKTAH